MRFPYVGELTAIDAFLLNSDFGHLAAPVKSPANANEVAFIRFGLSAPTDIFNKGWTLLMSNDSEAKHIQAFCAGTITFEPGSGVNRMILQNGDLLGTLVRFQEVPSWFPIPNYIIYENIDVEETRALLGDYLANSPKIVEALRETVADWGDTDSYLEKFFNGNASSGIPVKAGDTIGTAGPGTSGDRELTVLMQEELDSALYIDPALYPLHLENYFLDLLDHTLYGNFTDSFGPLVANGTVRFVKSDGGSAGPFASASAPAIDFTTAIAASNDYDTIVGLDSEWYLAEKIIITRPLSITSLNDTKVDVRVTPSSETFDLPALPVVRAAERGILVDSVTGYVSIANITVHGCSLSDATKPFPTGPGIFIYRSAKVYVYNCCSVTNRGSGSAPYKGNGGGINAYYCSPYIFRNFISGNEAQYGGGIFVGPFAYPVIKDNVIANNTALLDGGGICINMAPANFFLPDEPFYSNGFNEEEVEKARNSQILFVKNIIRNNLAKDDGGGVYLSIMAKAGFRENQVYTNIAWNAGGGVRATLGSDIEMNGDSIDSNQANYLYKTDSDPQEQIELNMNGGGGIAVRDSDLILRNTVVQGNIAHGFAGGGIDFSVSTEGPFDSSLGWAVEGWTGYDDYDDILRTLFMKQKVLLTCDEDVEIIENSCTKFENTIDDFRKGGGIYILRYRTDTFTALPMEIRIEELTQISGNQNDKISEIAANHEATTVINDSGAIESPRSNEFHLYDMVEAGVLIPAAEKGVLDSQTAVKFVDNDGVFKYISP